MKISMQKLPIAIPVTGNPKPETPTSGGQGDGEPKIDGKKLELTKGASSGSALGDYIDALERLRLENEKGAIETELLNTLEVLDDESSGDFKTFSG